MPPGGFNWLSQRLTLRSCYAEEKPGVESCRCSRNALGWASACGATGASGPVLGGDRSRCIEREGCGRGGCVAEHWCPVVPQGWRDAASRSRAGVGALSVVHRAGGDRGPARRWFWGAGRSRVGSVVRRRRSPESCNAMPRSDVAALNIEPRPPRGMLSVALNVPSRRSSR